MKLAVRRGRRRLRARPLFHLIPNMFTLLGLCAGLTGMRYALDGRWELAVGLVGAAILFDGLDGRSARMFNLESKLGEQLDSLADFLSFGVAPAILVYLWVLHDVRGLGWALALLFVSCSALRLARFNAELDEDCHPRWKSHFFTGIPAPCAAGLVLLPMVLSFSAGDGFARNWVLNSIMMAFVALMMVSHVPTFSLKKLRVRPDLVMPVLLGGVVIIVFLVTETWLALTLAGLAYLGSIPASIVVARRMRREEEAHAPAGGPAPAPAGDEEAGEPPDAR